MTIVRIQSPHFRRMRVRAAIRTEVRRQLRALVDGTVFAFGVSAGVIVVMMLLDVVIDHLP